VSGYVKSNGSRDSALPVISNIKAGLGCVVFQIPARATGYLLSTAIGPVLASVTPANTSVLGSLSPGISSRALKMSFSLLGAEIKKKWSYISTSQNDSLAFTA
jgi:hypothetical protein